VRAYPSAVPCMGGTLNGWMVIKRYSHAGGNVVAMRCLNPSVVVITQVIREQKTREKEAKEAELRELAMRARQERVGGAAVPLAARAADPYGVGGAQVRACL